MKKAALAVRLSVRQVSQSKDGGMFARLQDFLAPDENSGLVRRRVEPAGQLLRGSREDGTLVGGMCNRAVRARIYAMGNRLGIDHLSPHDPRRPRAPRIASSLNVRHLMDWFGWNSPAMAARYIESVRRIVGE